jgi:signal transduction histidine kinase
MRRFSWSSLRSRAILLVLLAILPLLALTVFSYITQRDRAIYEVQRDEIVAARNLATLQETLIGTTRHLLISLARLSQVQRHDRVACEALFAGVLAQSPYYGALLAVDRQGQLSASAPAASGPVNYADRLWFQEVVQTKTFVISEPIQGRLTQKYVSNLAYPILDEAGQLQGVVTVGLDLSWLGNQLARSDFPPGTAFALIDTTGKALFRYPEPLKYTGRMMPDLLVKAINSHDEGVVEVIGLPGDLRLVGFTRLSPPWHNLSMAVALPKHLALVRVNHDLWRNLIWLGLVALLALAAAWYGSDLFIVRPVRNLQGATDRLAAGDLTGRVGPDYPVGELGLLAQDFDKMADALQKREAELKEATAKLREHVLELNRRTAQLETANKELESFSYFVSHDLRGPLRGIAGFSRLLLERGADNLDDEGKRFLNIIISGTKKMGELIDDLLTFSRLGRKAMNIGTFQMEDLVRAVFDEGKNLEPGRTIHLEVKPLPAARADRSMMRQVWANLLANAIKFTRPRETAIIEVGGKSTEEENIYYVKDNGVGFNMQYADKLFGTFQRLHREDEFEGTGVGLALVQRIVQRHGGRVWAEGTAGEGVSFFFTLPNEKD